MSIEGTFLGDTLYIYQVQITLVLALLQYGT